MSPVDAHLLEAPQLNWQEPGSERFGSAHIHKKSREPVYELSSPANSTYNIYCVLYLYIYILYTIYICQNHRSKYSCNFPA